MKRIAWLDSTRMPSRIHATIDGENTICGHPFNEKFKENDIFHNRPRWEKCNDVPRSYGGLTRYCKECFKNSKKSLEWL